MSCAHPPEGLIVCLDMNCYRIVPTRKAYQVVATLPSGTRLLRTWRTEE